CDKKNTYYPDRPSGATLGKVQPLGLTGFLALRKIAHMGKLMVRSLVFLCSLFLALPPGWCCLFAIELTQPTPTPKQKTPTAPPTPGGPRQSQRTPPAPDPAPTDKPDSTKKPPVPPIGVCPCTDRQAILPTLSTDKPDDAGFVAILPPVDAM